MLHESHQFWELYKLLKTFKDEEATQKSQTQHNIRN